MPGPRTHALDGKHLFAGFRYIDDPDICSCHGTTQGKSTLFRSIVRTADTQQRRSFRERVARHGGHTEHNGEISNQLVSHRCPGHDRESERRQVTGARRQFPERLKEECRDPEMNGGGVVLDRRQGR